MTPYSFPPAAHDPAPTAPEGHDMTDPITSTWPTETMFVRFNEYNDHEGESWDWWLQITGNEQEIAKLAELLAATESPDGEEYFTLHPDDVERTLVVDKLVQYAEDGYFASHNLVEGTFTCPESLGEYGDVLYKGGIRKFFAGGVS